MKHILRVCMGSACHVKGAPGVAHGLMRELEQSGLDAEVELMGRFCNNECAKGVVVECENRKWFRVEEKDVPSIIEELKEAYQL